MDKILKKLSKKLPKDQEYALFQSSIESHNMNNNFDDMARSSAHMMLNTDRNPLTEPRTERSHNRRE